MRKDGDRPTGSGQAKAASPPCDRFRTDDSQAAKPSGPRQPKTLVMASGARLHGPGWMPHRGVSNGLGQEAAYDPVQIMLHWIVALLIGEQYLLCQIVLPGWHYLITTSDFYFTPGVIVHLFVGTDVLLLVTWRLWLRRRHPTPPPPEGFDPRLEALSRLVQRATYATMLAIPVTGLVAYFGDLQLVSIVHNALTLVLLGLIATHACGALYHQFVRRDGLLARMLRS